MRRRLLTLAIVVAILGVGWVLARDRLTIDHIAAQEARLRAAIAARPLASFFAGLLAYVGLSFLPLPAGKSLVFGWLFGLWQGIVLANLGLTIAAAGMFLLSRYVLREGLRSRFGAFMARLDRAVEADGAYYLFALRVMHAPYTLLNYGMGATSLKAGAFWWATQAGLLPGNVLFTYAGTQLPTLREVADEGLTSVASPQLIAAFLLVGVLPLSVRWIVRRVWRRAGRGGAGRTGP